MARPDRSRQRSSGLQNEELKTIKRSARYPRVAVLLGVNQHYYIPLVICRSFSTIFTLIWAAQACLHIYHLVIQAPSVAVNEDAKSQRANTILTYRLQLVQVALSFVWVCHPSFTLHQLSQLQQCPESTTANIIPGRRSSLSLPPLRVLPHVPLALNVLPGRSPNSPYRPLSIPFPWLHASLPSDWRSHPTA